MKKTLFIFLVVLCGCSGNPRQNVNAWIETKDKVKVLSTTAMIGDLVKRIGGDDVSHLTLIVGDIDPHSYELVKGDDEKIESADLVFYNGLGLEHGASLQYRLKHHPHAIAVGDFLFKEDRESFLLVGAQIDPHIWMDVSLWAKIIPYIVKALSEIDPIHASEYAKRAENLEKQLNDLHREICDMFQKIPKERRFLVTSHDAFNYFAKRYLAEKLEPEEMWRERFKAPEGLAPDGQLGLIDLKRIIDHLCAYQIPVVFPESNVNRDALKKIISICKSKNHHVFICDEALFGDTMGSYGSGVESYMEMIRHNAEVISKHLREKGHG